MLNIGLDLDGVICEWKYLPKVDRIKENYDNLEMIIGAKWGLQELAVYNNITIITARHYLGAYNHIVDWMFSKFPEFNAFDLVAGIPTSEKWRVIQAMDIDVHVDDNTRAFQRLPLHVSSILFRGSQNEDQEWDGFEVHSWPELTKAIETLKERK